MSLIDLNNVILITNIKKIFYSHKIKVSIIFF